METHNKPTRVTGAAEALRVVEGILWHYENKEKGGRIVIEITVTEDTGVIRCGFCNRVIERSGRRKYCDGACRVAAHRLRKKEGEAPSNFR